MSVPKRRATSSTRSRQRLALDGEVVVRPGQLGDVVAVDEHERAGRPQQVLGGPPRVAGDAAGQRQRRPGRPVPTSSSPPRRSASDRAERASSRSSLTWAPDTGDAAALGALGEQGVALGLGGRGPLARPRRGRPRRPPAEPAPPRPGRWRGARRRRASASCVRRSSSSAVTAAGGPALLLDLPAELVDPRRELRPARRGCGSRPARPPPAAARPAAGRTSSVDRAAASSAAATSVGDALLPAVLAAQPLDADRVDQLGQGAGGDAPAEVRRRPRSPAATAQRRRRDPRLPEERLQRRRVGDRRAPPLALVGDRHGELDGRAQVAVLERTDLRLRHVERRPDLSPMRATERQRGSGRPLRTAADGVAGERCDMACERHEPHVRAVQPPGVRAGPAGPSGRTTPSRRRRRSDGRAAAARWTTRGSGWRGRRSRRASPSRHVADVDRDGDLDGGHADLRADEAEVVDEPGLGDDVGLDEVQVLAVDGGPVHRGHAGRRPPRLAPSRVTWTWSGCP